MSGHSEWLYSVSYLESVPQASTKFIVSGLKSLIKWTLISKICPSSRPRSETLFMILSQLTLRCLSTRSIMKSLWVSRWNKLMIMIFLSVIKMTRAWMTILTLKTSWNVSRILVTVLCSLKKTLKSLCSDLLEMLIKSKKASINRHLMSRLDSQANKLRLVKLERKR